MNDRARAGAVATGSGTGQGRAGGLHLPAEGLDVDALGREQMQCVLGAPGGVLPQMEGVRVAGQPCRAGE
jgi:hypothetical protein